MPRPHIIEGGSPFPVVEVDDCAGFDTRTVGVVLWDDGTAFVEVFFNSIPQRKRFLLTREFLTHQDALDFAKSLPNTPQTKARHDVPQEL